MSFAGEFLDMLSFKKRKNKTSRTKQGSHSRSSSISTVPATSGATVLSTTATARDSNVDFKLSKAQIDVEPAMDTAEKSIQWEGCRDAAVAALDHLKMICERTEHVASLKDICKILAELLKIAQVLDQDTHIYTPLSAKVERYKKFFEDEVGRMEEEDAAPDPDSPLIIPIQLYARVLEDILMALIKDCAPSGGGTNRQYEEIKASLERGGASNLEAKTMEQLISDLTSAFKQLKAIIQVYMGRESVFKSQRQFDAEAVPVQTNEPSKKPRSAAITSGGSQHGTCLQGTREEILTEIEDWSQAKTECRVFCIVDMAGTGKSTIANHMARKWKKEKRLVARFFFSKGNAGTTTGKDLCIWMAQELGINHPTLSEKLEETLKKKDTIASLPLETQWEELVSNHAIRLDLGGGPYFFVVDALDECIESERQVLLTSLLRTIDAITPSEPNLRLLLTTRPEADITAVLDEEGDSVASQHRILRRLAGGNVNLDDISLYVRHQLRRIDLSAISSEQREQLIKRSEGLFIFASTACSLLTRSYDPKAAFQQIMSSRDSSLDGLYQEVLRTAVPEDGNSIELVRQVLAVILAANQPLSMETISRFLGYTGNVSAQQTVQGLGSVLASGRPDEAVYILHPTFREFLLRHGRSELYAVNIRVGHRLLAMACLEQLMSELKHDVCRIKLPGIPTPSHRSDIGSDYKLHEYTSEALRYSTTWWTGHASHALHKHVVRALMLNFFSEKLLDWLELLELLQETVATAQSVIQLQEHLRRHMPLDKDLRIHEDYVPLLEWLKDTVDFIHSMEPFWTNESLAPYRTSLMYWQYPGPVFNCYASKQLEDRPIVRLSVKKEKGFLPSLIFYGHSDKVQDIAFSPDGQHIASSSGDETVRIWSTSSGLQEAEYRLPRAQSLAYLSSGKGLIATTLDSLIYYLNLDDEFSDPREISTGAKFTQCSVCVSPKDDFLLCGTDRGELVTVDPHINTIKGRLQAHTKAVNRVDISMDGTIFASCSDDGTIAIWRGDLIFLSSRPLHIFSCKEEACSNAHTMLLSSRSRTLIASCSELRLWNIDSDEVAAYPNDMEGEKPLAFSSDGKFLITTTEHWLQLRDGQTGQLITSFQEMPVETPSNPAFSRDGRVLAVVSEQKINMWRLEDMLANKRWEPPSYEQAACWAFSSDQKRAAQNIKFEDETGRQQEELIIWDLMEGRTLASSRESKGNWTMIMSFSPRGQFIFCAGRRSIELRNGFSGELIGREATLPEAQYVHRILASPCETIVALARGDSKIVDNNSETVWKEVSFWSVENQSQLTPMFVIELSPPISCSPTGNEEPIAGFDSHGRLFRVNDMVWDISSRPLLQLLQEETEVQLQEWPARPQPRLRHSFFHGLQFGRPSFEYYKTPFYLGFAGTHIEGDLAVAYDEHGRFVVLDFSHMEVPVRSQEIMDQIEASEEMRCIIS